MDAEDIPRPAKILLVEDSPTDALLAQEALRGTHISNNIHIVEDGEEALAFLHGEGPYAQAPRPDLILLDLNLPKKGGQEVLEEIKTDPELKDIPVVVLTTSQDVGDVSKAYDLHANCYITKPVDFLQFTEVVQAIAHFWFAVVTLPRR
jgi:two-component system, chemotaxis family, response regulator Rcp1